MKATCPKCGGRRLVATFEGGTSWRDFPAGRAGGASRQGVVVCMCGWDGVIWFEGKWFGVRTNRGRYLGSWHQEGQ